MQDRHRDRIRYFKEQGITTQKYVIPYIESHMKITPDKRVLEVGCGEGGNMMPFIEIGCETFGIDIGVNAIKNAKLFIPENTTKTNFHLIADDIYNITTNQIGTFDVIFLRDVIEHIHNQEKFMAFVKQFLKPEGVMFFGFPPWRMPFGGHQQICKNKFLSSLPYYHLLPKSIYTRLLKMGGEPQYRIDNLTEVKETGISIRRFENMVDKENFEFLKKDLFFINPNYEIKFNLKPKKVISPFSTIPFFKDFYTTCVYCLIRVKVD